MPKSASFKGLNGNINTVGDSDKEAVNDKPQETIKTGYNDGAPSDSSLSQDKLQVCDIMGAWGAYQWSITLFATIYSGLFGITVTVGPIWTPEMQFVCAQSQAFINQTAENISFGAQQTGGLNQCFINSTTGIECSKFIYDDLNYGKLMTNTFDLVCGRQWLRSFLSSSALIGMLVSSFTLGVLSDRFGRMACTRLGFLVALLSNLGAILCSDYLMLNICIMLMSFAQNGVGNALATLIMESTTPKWRFVSVFQYGFGWGLGLMLTPFLNNLTKNYQHFLIILLAAQIFMLAWLRFGVFESIRWLLSEGQINRAQIELQRACRFNRRPNGAGLAQRIAQMQLQQLRKASMMIESKSSNGDAESFAGDLIRTAFASQPELGAIGAAIDHQAPPSPVVPSRQQQQSNNNQRRPSPASFNILDNVSFGVLSDNLDATAAATTVTATGNGINCDAKEENSATTTGALNHPKSPQSLSPFLVRKSFSLGCGENSATDRNRNFDDSLSVATSRNNSFNYDQTDGNRPQSKGSLNSQANLSYLAMKYSLALHKQEEGCFLAQMFHRKLYKTSIVLVMLSFMLETSYYGLVQANSFVGSDVDLNYIASALAEWAANVLYMLTLLAFSRKAAVLTPTLIASLCCLGIAITYQLIPNSADSLKQSNEMIMELKLVGDNRTGDGMLLMNAIKDQVDSIVVEDTDIQHSPALDLSFKLRAEELASIDLRELINFWLVNVGKLGISVGCQVAATIAMEVYPNNLRQTGQGVIMLVGRISSIIAPFLFNDHSQDKLILKSTLVCVSIIGIIASILVPFFIRDTKNMELCDRLNEIDAQKGKEKATLRRE